MGPRSLCLYKEPVSRGIQNEAYTFIVKREISYADPVSVLRGSPFVFLPTGAATIFGKGKAGGNLKKTIDKMVKMCNNIHEIKIKTVKKYKNRFFGEVTYTIRGKKYT